MGQKAEILEERFFLDSDGLRLAVYLARPANGYGPFPAVQIHHGGGGYEPVYEHMAARLAERGLVGVAMVHRGYPGSTGRMEYGKGEIVDIGNLVGKLRSLPYVWGDRLGIMGYSRGAHNALLALERYDDFRAGALWSPPVDMFDHVEVNPWIAPMFGGGPGEVPEEYEKRSAIRYVDQVSCPLLILHGESDDVIPVRHSHRLAEELRRLGKDFELKTFPREGHIWSPTGFYHNWELTLEFFERHLGW